MRKVLYPGSFDPITYGHENIVKQALELFDEVIIAVFNNTNKKTNMFTVEERTEMIKEIYKQYSNVKVIIGTGAATDVALINECKAIVRGLRGLSDFEYEIQLSSINKQISNGKINTVCLFSDNNYQFVSSTMVKEVFNLKKDISNYVEPNVEEKMIAKRKVNNNEK